MKEEIKKLERLKKWKNLFEIKRINIAILLLKKYNYREITKILWCGFTTISWVKNRYKKDSEYFYKTNYKWRKSIYWKEIEDKAQRLIKEWEKNNKWYSIQDMSNKLWFWDWKKWYRKTYYLLREKMNLRYQKPYVVDKKAPKNNKEILKKTLKLI